MSAMLRFAFVLLLFAGLAACGTAPNSVDGDGDPIEPIPEGKGRLTVTTPGLPDDLSPAITPLSLVAADDCQSAECAPARST